MRKNLFEVLTAGILFLMPGFMLSQVPNLGSASGFALFTSVGTFTNGTGGATNVTGNVGTNSGSYGFGNGTLNGTSYVANATSAQAAADLNTAYNALTSVACGTTISNSLGSLTLTPNVYCTPGAASLTGTLTLDGQGNPNAIFIIKTGAGLTLTNSAKVNLINSASQCNVYWQVNGTLTLGNSSIIRGTVLANGAIDLQQGATVNGRALTKTGNITLKNSIAAVAFAPVASSISAGGTTSFCVGGSVVLSGNTGGTWTPGGSTITTITATSSGTYYVTNTSNCGSITSNSIIVTVNPLPTVTVNSGTICGGNSLILNASGASTYSWSPGGSLSATTGASVSANPAITTTYSLTGTSVAGCVKTVNTTITVNSTPTVTVSSATICEGNSAILTASGANSYTWSPAAFLNTTNGATVTSNATVTTNYTVTGTNAVGCTNSASSNVAVNSKPIISVNSATICEGNSVMLTASGATTYSWSPAASLSASTGSTVTANPPISTTYTITGTNSNGCVNSTSAMVSVNSNPTISVNSATICEGSSTSLTASGAATYSWSPSTGLSATSGANVMANPTVTIVYTITGTTGNCTDSKMSTVTVNALPEATVSASGSTSFCQGGHVILTASPANSHSWSNNEATQSVTVTATGDYSCTVTGANGCSKTSSLISVICSSIPTVAVNSATICSGSSTVLNASGADTYSWEPSGSLDTSTGTSVTASPGSTTVYTITGTTNEGCANTTTASVEVVPNPTVSISGATICVGTSTTLTATSATAYLWNGGETTNSISVTPNATRDYTVTGTTNGCAYTEIFEVVVNAQPSVSITASPISICSGASSTLTASGAVSYLWDTGETTASISVSPVVTTSYVLTGTGANGCSKTTSVNVNVNSCSSETAVSSVPCGNSYNNFNSYSTCKVVQGATAYRFTFYDNTTNALIAVKTQTSNYIYFNTVAGLVYGTTYKWTVAVNKGNGFGPESNNGCIITFNLPQTKVPCGNSYNNLNSYSYCAPVFGALGYRFTFYDNSTNAIVAAKAQVSNNIYFNTIPELAYGQTYKWTVEVLYNNGTNLLWAPSSSSLCTITFNAPQTALPCGNIYASATAYAGVASVMGASAYRFTFYDNVTGALVAVKTNGTNYVYFNQVPGLTFNRIYKWTVEVLYNNGTSNVFGPPSSNACTMTWGTIYEGKESMVNNTAERIGIQLTYEGEINLTNVYPNPNNGDFIVQLPGAREVEITNVLGEKIINKVLFEGLSNISLSNQPDGIYFVKIRSGDKQEVVKVIKEN